MQHEAGVTGASGGQIAISTDDFAMHAKPICEQNVAGRYEYERRYILYFEKEGDLNRSEKAKPTASPALKNRLFWFDLIRYGLQALAGRPHRRTTSCV
jgi:hypothetical protein